MTKELDKKNRKARIAEVGSKQEESPSITRSNPDQPEPSPSKKSGSNPTKEPSKSLNKALSEKGEDAGQWGKLLGTVQDINPSLGKDSLKIYINGIDADLKDHPTIKACPLTFRWRKKEDNVKNGDQITNKGYMVLSKRAVKAQNIPIRVNKDDTPEEDFYSVAEVVLCFTSKKDYERRKLEQSIRDTLRPREEKDRRNEFAKAQSKLDAHTAKRNYEAQGQSDSELIPSKLPDDPEEALQKAYEIANESDTVDL